MQTSIVRGCLVTIGVLAVAATTIAYPASAYTPVELDRDRIIELTNDARIEEGVTPLTEHALLSSVAQEKARRIAETGDFAHTLADGTTAWDLLLVAGYAYSHAGENLAVHFVREEALISAWMRSPSHRMNILDADFEEIGIGAAKGVWKGDVGYFVVQLFATPL